MKRRIRRTAAVVGVTRDRIAADLKKAFRVLNYPSDILPQDLKSVPNCRRPRGPGDPSWTGEIRVYCRDGWRNVHVCSTVPMTELRRTGLDVVWKGPNYVEVFPRGVDYQQFVG